MRAAVDGDSSAVARPSQPPRDAPTAAPLPQ